MKKQKYWMKSSQIKKNALKLKTWLIKKRTINWKNFNRKNNIIDSKRETLINLKK